MTNLIFFSFVCLIFLGGTVQAWEVSGLPNPSNETAATPIVVPFPDHNVPVLGEGFDLVTGERRAANCVQHGDQIKVIFNN